MNRLKEIHQRTEGALPALTLVLVSMLSALVAVLGLETWVAIAAALAAMVSGSQVINREVVIPWRLKSANNAVARLYARTADGHGQVGSAVQIAPRRWVTAAHAMPIGATVKLKLGDTWSQPRVIYRDEELDLAVMEIDDHWPWLARISLDLPEPGTLMKVTGWTNGRRDKNNRDRGVRVVQDYTVQGPVEESLIVLTGAVPPIGFSGATAADVVTGKVVGVLSGFSPGRRDPHGLPELDEVHATPLSCIPAEYLR
ncbi:trypsin-like peptidase domain-containing protein [Streptomyces sp. NPDC060000]|uniref:trypsin-like peptidase domain-containing protein n=1 Tax=Streptomyces sp. NPDC060000 TaxID=3347031 RepID=UPI0036870E53